MSEQVLVATDIQAREAYWRRIFGADVLPVRSVRPRPWVLGPGRHETMCFDLDTDRLHPQQRERLAHAVARQQRISIDEARKVIESPIPIPARGCRVLRE